MCEGKSGLDDKVQRCDKLSKMRAKKNNSHIEMQ